MQRETVELDERAQQRLLILNHILAAELTAAEAADCLGLSVRSVRRLLARYRSAEGAAALVHGNRGRTPGNRVDDALRMRLVDLAQHQYRGVNRAHLAELLAERESIAVAERTLRRILAEAGLAAVKKRRPRGHRLRRERMRQAVTRDSVVEVHLTPHAFRHGLALALPESVDLHKRPRQDTGTVKQTGVRIVVAGKEDWTTAAGGSACPADGPSNQPGRASPLGVGYREAGDPSTSPDRISE